MITWGVKSAVDKNNTMVSLHSSATRQLEARLGPVICDGVSYFETADSNFLEEDDERTCGTPQSMPMR